MTHDITRADAAAHLRAGFTEPSIADQQRQARIGESFRYDAEADRLLQLADTDPDRFAKLPRQTRMSVGFYQGQRDAAYAAGYYVGPGLDDGTPA